MRTYIQILGTHTHDSTPSVLVHSENQRYLVNCGEGTQRFCGEHRVRFGLLDTVLLTRVHWDCFGGLPGMLLTVADSKAVSAMRVVGPRNTTRALNACRHFTQRKDFMVDTVELGREQGSLDDRYMTVTAVPLQKSQLQQRQRVDGTVADHEDLAQLQEEKRQLLKVFASRHNGTTVAEPPTKKCCTSVDVVEDEDGHAYAKSAPSSPAQTTSSPPSPPSSPSTHRSLSIDETSLCYIFSGKELRRKFNNAKAKALGFPLGPLCARVTAGETVTLDDGRVIHADDVCDPPQDGKIVMVVDVPTVEYVHALASAFKVFQTGGTSAKRVHCIVHCLGDGILTLPAYRKFIESFHEQVEHIIVAKEYCAPVTTFPTAALQQAKLGMMDKDVFRQPYERRCAAKQLPGDMNVRIHAAKQLLQLDLEPGPCKLVWNSVNEFDVDKAFNAFHADKTNASYIEAVAALPTVTAETHTWSTATQLAFLGTGSMMPSKYRNVSGIAALLPRGMMTMDSGEGTYGQLYRLFGPEESRRLMSAWKVAFISHMHADHHLGLVQLVSRWSEIADPTSRLLLIAPGPLWRFLHDFSHCQPLPLDRIDFVNAHALRFERQHESPCTDTAFELAMQSMGVDRCVTMFVDHCPNAFGIAWSTKEALDGDGDLTQHRHVHVAYSGDTRPTASVSAAIASLHDYAKEHHGHTGDAETCLIHEATFEDEMHAEARMRKHSTWSEAMAVGRQSHATELMLTHFSQRYPKIPAVLAEAKPDGVPAMAASATATRPNMAIGLAFDLMVVPVGGGIRDRLARIHPALVAYKSE